MASDDAEKRRGFSSFGRLFSKLKRVWKVREKSESTMTSASILRNQNLYGPRAIFVSQNDLGNSHLKLNGDCHPDFVAHPIGCPSGPKLCVRKNPECDPHAKKCPTQKCSGPPSSNSTSGVSPSGCRNGTFQNRSSPYGGPRNADFNPYLAKEGDPTRGRSYVGIKDENQREARELGYLLIPKEYDGTGFARSGERIYQASTPAKCSSRLV